MNIFQKVVSHFRRENEQRKVSPQPEIIEMVKKDNYNPSEEEKINDQNSLFTGETSSDFNFNPGNSEQIESSKPEPGIFSWMSQPIFISSTFSDMMAERSLLINVVFKDLEERLIERCVHLEPIDLRWGIETSIEKEKQNKELMVLKVCLGEIERSKPFFIGILGDRYGWIPPPIRIENAESEHAFTSSEKRKSITSLEIEYGVLSDKIAMSRCYFFFREPLPYNEMPENIRNNYCDYSDDEAGREKKELLLSLKEAIIGKVGKERVFYYKAGWNGEKVTELEDFRMLVTELLWKELDDLTKELENKRPKSWQEEERKYLKDFVESHTVSFSGREEITGKLLSFALSKTEETKRVLCIIGESGIGKSSVAAKLYTKLNNEDVLLLSHAAGISQRSHSLVFMLRIWIEEIGEELNLNVAEELELKKNYEEIRELFFNLLETISSRKRVVVLVDALNQFEKSHNAKNVNWLPEILPPNVRAIFTSIEGEETENLTKRKDSFTIEMSALKETEAEKIIETICKRYSKVLNTKVIKNLLQKKRRDGNFSFINPLWLTIAVDIFIQMGEEDFSQLRELEGDQEQKLENLLLLTAANIPVEISEIYNLLFDRCKIFGEKFSESVLNYIGTSRYGLRESDIENLTKNYSGIGWETVNFASLRRYLRNHLVRKGELGLWDFRHAQARESLKKRLSYAQSNEARLHSAISAHLEVLSNTDPLRQSEILWHLYNCDDKNKFIEICGNQLNNDKTNKEFGIAVKDIIVETGSGIRWLLSVIDYRNDNSQTKYSFLSLLIGQLVENITYLIPLHSQLKIVQAIIKEMLLIGDQHKSDPLYLRDLAIAYLSEGNICEGIGNYEQQRISYENSLKIRELLYEQNPEIEIFAYDLSLVYLRLCDLYAAAGEINLAMQSVEKQFSIIEGFSNETRNSERYLQSICSYYERIAHLYDDQGEYAKAFQNFNEIVKIFSDEGNSLLLTKIKKHILAVTYMNMGKVLGNVDDNIESLKYFNKAHYLFLEYINKNPDSVELLIGLSILYDNIGRLYNSEEEYTKALEYFEKSLGIREDIRRKVVDSNQIYRLISVSYDRIGEIYERKQELRESLIYYEKSFNIRKELRAKNPTRKNALTDIALSYEIFGDIYDRLGEKSKSKENYENALSILISLKKEYPWSVQIAKGLALIYDKLFMVFDLRDLLIEMKTKNMYIDETVLEMCRRFGVR